MNSFASIADVVGRALLHSVWEGAVIAMLFAIAMLALRKRSAPARYVAACITLLGMLLAPIATIVLRPTTQPLHHDIAAAVSVQPMPFAQPQPRGGSTPTVAVPERPALSMLQYATIVWSLGFFIVSLWQIAGWLTVRKFVGRAQPADEVAVDRLHRLCGRMRIRFPIALRICDQLTTPALVGWLRPVILIPPAALCDLPVDYFEALLLHELAHIRRHDYLINLLQAIAETLLFYHPAAWWVSRVIRDERENCCDDEVVRQTDAKTYVRALALMESQRADSVGGLALTATGGRLLHRIERLTGHAGNRRPAAGTIATLVLLCLVIVVSACYAAKTPERSQTQPAPHSTTKIEGPTRAVRPEDLAFAATGEYRIQPGDRLTVRTAEFNGPNTVDNRNCVVSDSGEIRLSLVPEALKVAGMTDAEAEKAIIESYRTHRLIERANVNLIVTERQRQVFTVVGAVMHAGQFNLTDSRLRILNAIAIAGGTLPGEVNRIVVLREADDRGMSTAIEIPADRLLAGDPSVNIAIRPLDTVVVSHGESAISQTTLDPLAPAPAATVDKPAGEYHIAPEDLIQIQIADLTGPNKETVKQARVNERGGIIIPLLTEPIPAAGLTEIQLEKAITEAYKQAALPEHPVLATVIEAHVQDFGAAIPKNASSLMMTTHFPRAGAPLEAPALLPEDRQPLGPATIGPNDLLQIHLVRRDKQETVKQARVTAAGEVSLPNLQHPINIDQMTPAQAATAIQQAYHDAGQDDEAGQLEIDAEELSLKKDRDKLDRYKALLKTRGVTQNEVDDVALQVDIDEKKVAHAKADLQRDIKDVSVSHIEARRYVFSVIGNVKRSGAWPMDGKATVRQALEAAGGVMPNSAQALVLHRQWPVGKPDREFKLDIDKVFSGDASMNLPLRPGDVLMVGVSR